VPATPTSTDSAVISPSTVRVARPNAIIVACSRARSSVPMEAVLNAIRKTSSNAVLVTVVYSMRELRRAGKAEEDERAQPGGEGPGGPAGSQGAAGNG
jgi:hypothetical protein